ncbi:MAG TPA: PocR ligand-binding domain-containing protein [Clostridiaceae bacterium]
MNGIDYKFSDIFDLVEIQEIQDAFSSATGVASIITEIDGTPITKPSNFCYFCNEVVRKTEKGMKNCMISDSIIGSPKKDGPRLQRCLSGGLMDGGASIMVGDKHIANWLIGQILDSDYKIDDMLAYADEIGVDRDIVTNALHEVTPMPKQQFSDICNFLFLTASQLSKLAIKNVVQAEEIAKRKVAEKQFKQLNEELEKNVLERTYQLEEINAALEIKVIERTSQLQDMNAILEEEIMEKTQAENELKKERFFTDAVIDSVPGLLYLYDDNQKLVRWNKNHEVLTGYSSDELSQMRMMDWFKGDEESIADVTIAIQKTLEQGKGQVEANLQKKDGTNIPVYFTSITLELDGRLYFTGIGSDMTILRRKEKENLYLSYHDVLTGLYNRRFYEEEIKRLDTKENLPISIIMGDVNGLKIVNDAFGHDKGDELLQKAAVALKGACRSEDIVARWGGDEFVILLPRTSPDKAEKIINRIKELYSNEQVNAISVSISFGWDTKVNMDEDIQKVLKSAEDYMYKHKILEKADTKGNIVNTIISTLHEKNPREEQHSKRVSEICQKIGKALGFSALEVSQLKVIGLLHDIGKIAIEEGILNKAGKLTVEEWDEIKRHPDIGYRILSSSYDMLGLADFVLEHHERWDGAGYPKSLKGEEISTVARIIALADSYDAMTSERPYRKAMSEEVACNEIRKGAGTQFDPKIARIFVEKVLEKTWD